MSKLKFKEERKFRNWEFYAIFGLIILGASYRLFEHLYTQAIINSWIVLGYSSIILISGLLIYLFKTVKLVTVVSKKGIKYQLYPFHLKRQKIKWEDIEDYKIVKLRDNSRWSGWNVNFNSDHRRFGLGESAGLFVNLKSGENVFIGVESDQELKKSMEKLMNG